MLLTAAMRLGVTFIGKFGFLHGKYVGYVRNYELVIDTTDEGLLKVLRG